MSKDESDQSLLFDYNYLCGQFQTIPKKQNLSIDEPIIPFTGQSSLKQYNAAKPHK